jgi:pyruvate dehydrogenase E2 component (dihydrolipoamide acetyltransferase)
VGDKIRTNEHVNIGVAVAVDEGLLVPVIKFADGKSLSHISALEVKDLAGKKKQKTTTCRNGRLNLHHI